MKLLIKDKALGFYLLLAAGILAVVSFIYYLTWSQAHYVMNNVVLVGLGAGVAINLLLLFLDNDFLIVAATAAYSVALCQLLVDSVGSFADAFQGIVMFGDPTQVSTIASISVLMAAGIVATIASGFLKRKRA